MLVLSRREGETLVFPELDVVLEVLAIKGNAARIGIRAPSKIKVLRGELARSREKLAAIIDGRLEDPSGKLMHRVRNWLHAAGLRMQLIRRYLEADRLEEAADLIQAVLDDFRSIEEGDATAAEFRDLPALDFGAASGCCDGTTHRALLVEDNANERHLLAGYLRTSGFQVETAGDGAAALEWLRTSERPDLVLLDMSMPVCDGPTLLRTIRAERSFDDMKVFAVSGSSPATWDITVGPEGVDRWFEKPVDPQNLVREICRELRGRELAKPR